MAVTSAAAERIDLPRSSMDRSLSKAVSDDVSDSSTSPNESSPTDTPDRNDASNASPNPSYKDVDIQVLFSITHFQLNSFPWSLYKKSGRKKKQRESRLGLCFEFHFANSWLLCPSSRIITIIQSNLLQSFLKVNFAKLSIIRNLLKLSCFRGEIRKLATERNMIFK